MADLELYAPHESISTSEVATERLVLLEIRASESVSAEISISGPYIIETYSDKIYYFSDLIALPTSEKVFLAEIQVAEEITSFWSLTAGQTYTYEISYLNETVTLADSSTDTIRKAIVSCECEGSALTAKTSIATVEANTGSYWHDTANSKLYVHPSDNGNPNGDLILTYFWLYFGSKGIILGARYYEPYISESGVPNLSQNISDMYWGVSEISVGALILNNGSGYFDQISAKFIWTNKKIRLLFGGESLPYGEYVSVFNGKIGEKTFNQRAMTLNLKSNSFDLLRQLPVNHFWISDMPLLDSAAEGAPIPYYYGEYSDQNAPIVTCTNFMQHFFKICDTTYHPIKEITSVQIDYGDGSGWQPIIHTDVLSTATFHIFPDLAKWVPGTSRVKAAFKGYCDAWGNLIEKGADIVYDLLVNQCGYAAEDIDMTSFSSSASNSDRVLNVSIHEDQAITDVIERICKSDLAFFDEDGSGKLRYRLWNPFGSGTLPSLTDSEILETPDTDDDPINLYWKVVIGYGTVLETGNSLYYELINSDVPRKYGKHETLTIDTYLRNEDQVKKIIGYINYVSRHILPIIKLPTKGALIGYDLGDLLDLTLTRSSYSTVGGISGKTCEIMGKDISFYPLRVELTLRDPLGFGDNSGYWMGPSAPDWATATPAERAVSGFWSDTYGYIVPGDSSTRNESIWW